jgi:hypothetical protein
MSGDIDSRASNTWDFTSRRARRQRQRQRHGRHHRGRARADRHRFRRASSSRPVRRGAGLVGRRRHGRDGAEEGLEHRGVLNNDMIGNIEGSTASSTTRSSACSRSRRPSRRRSSSGARAARRRRGRRRVAAARAVRGPDHGRVLHEPRRHDDLPPRPVRPRRTPPPVQRRRLPRRPHHGAHENYVRAASGHPRRERHRLRRRDRRRGLRLRGEADRRERGGAGVAGVGAAAPRDVRITGAVRPSATLRWSAPPSQDWCRATRSTGG